MNYSISPASGFNSVVQTYSASTFLQISIVNTVRVGNKISGHIDYEIKSVVRFCLLGASRVDDYYRAI